jgi:Leucine-rich repeat (LRR) protein
LADLPEEFSNLKRLTTLLLALNKFAALPRSICELVALEVLDLRSNRLATLPPDISHLSRLSRLLLSSNVLKAIPEELCVLKDLESLNLEGNELSELPAGIGALAKVNDVNIANNRFTTLPRQIARINNLKYLNMLGTQVTATGSGFGATQGSSTINFNGTPATTIVSWSNTQIVANVPNAATTGPVTVVVNSAGSNATVVFTAVNPVITSLSPPASPVGGSVVVNEEIVSRICVSDQLTTVSAHCIDRYSAAPLGRSKPGAIDLHLATDRTTAGR